MYVDDKRRPNIEDEDQCKTCHHYKSGVACPLLEALGQGVVTMDGQFFVKNCGFYVKYRRPLKIVGDTPDDITPKTQ